MRQLTRITFAMLAVTLVVGLLSAQDQPPKIKGTLPANWGKLGLSDVQKKKVYDIQAEYRPKIETLEKIIWDLKKAERESQEKVLTEEQKKTLNAILTGKNLDEKP